MASKFDTLFLDVDRLRDMETQAYNEGLVQVSELLQEDSVLDTFPPIPSKDIGQLLFLLTMYEHVDSSLSEFSWSRFIDEGIIRDGAYILEGCNLCAEDACVQLAKELAYWYKDDCIEAMLAGVNKALGKRYKDLHFFNINEIDNPEERLYKHIFRTVPGNYSLIDDYEKVIDGLIIGNFELGIDPALFAKGVHDNPQWDMLGYNNPELILDNLLDSIYCSKKNNVSYASSIFRYSKNQKDIDDINRIYLTQCKFISNLQVMPMPESFEDVFKFRKDPNLIAFRGVLNQWIDHVDNGEFDLANKMKKDLITANNALEKLGKVKRIGEHPVTIVLKFLGSVLIDLLAGDNYKTTILLGAEQAIEPVVFGYLEDKYSWKLLLRNQ